MVQGVTRELGKPYRPVCRELDVPYSSLMRWKRHRDQGKAAIGVPGPGKTEALDLPALNAEIRELAHGRERTRGTGALYGKYREQISRRDLQELVRTVRLDLREEAEARSRRIEWLVPGAVWSMDDAQLERLRPGHGHMHVVHDLGSRYTLKSLGSRELSDGGRVAQNLEALFNKHGAPLFMKRDNGSNLNHHEVDETLGRHWVIALNSPAHYPPYNGAIEKKQRELQTELESRLGAERVGLRVFELETELSGHELNHHRRRSLNGRTACRALEDGRLAVRTFGRRQRREVYEEIQWLTVDIIGMLGDDKDMTVETAFRIAAETWMQKNNIIRVTRNGEVLPCYYQFRSH